MIPRPTFLGDPDDFDALSAYEAELRAWEAARQQEVVDHDELSYLIDAAEQRLESLGLAKAHDADRVLLFGAGDPQPDMGHEGVGYLDYLSTTLWLKKDGAWQALGALASHTSGGSGPPGPAGPPGMDGEDGDDGMDGADGAPGSVWFEGTGPPGAGLGIDGDFYLDDANGDVYQKIGGTWTLVANIKGPAGADGADGEGVPAGGTADQYLAKINATDFNTEWRSFDEVDLMRRKGGTSGTQSISGTVTVAWDSTDFNLGAAFTVISAASFDVEEDGYYELGFSIEIDNTSGSVSAAIQGVSAIWQADAGAGFADIGFKAYIHEFTTSLEPQTLHLVYPTFLSQDDRLRVRVAQITGAHALVITKVNSVQWIRKIESATPETGP